MNKIEKCDKDIIIIRSKYEITKAIMVFHGIISSEMLGGMSIYGESSGNRRVAKPSEASSSGTSACH